MGAGIPPGISRVTTDSLSATGRGTRTSPLVVPPTGNVVDLRTQYDVVADDASYNSSNVAAINQAILDYSGTRSTLLLPTGEIYIDKAGSNWSILFGEGNSDLVLAGAGQFATCLVQHGTGTGADWAGLRVEQATRIGLRDFGIAPSPTLDTTIAISLRQLATYDTGRVGVTSTPGTP